MTTTKYDYAVIEDNGGGLHLYLFAPGTETAATAFDGFEYNPGSLLPALDALDAGDDARGWDGRKADAQADWDDLHKHDFGYEVICYRSTDDAARTIYPDRMGRAGQIEFGIETE